MGMLTPSAAKATAACRAKGGTDPKIVWPIATSIKWSHPAITHGSIAISDNGDGTILGWCFNWPHQNNRRAIEDCRKKGGQKPKLVAEF
jgi:hypothetical protein